jgi:hypothetical protein
VVNQVQSALRNLNLILCEHHGVCKLARWIAFEKCGCDVVGGSMVFQVGYDVGVSWCVLVCFGVFVGVTNSRSRSGFLVKAHNAVT